MSTRGCDGLLQVHVGGHEQGEADAPALHRNVLDSVSQVDLPVHLQLCDCASSTDSLRNVQS